MSTCNRRPTLGTRRHAGRRRVNAALLLGALATSAIGCAGDLGPANDNPIDDAPAFSVDLMISDNLPGLGEAQFIDFGPDVTITTVFILIRHSFLVSPIAERARLEMTITSVDGFPGHFHGTAMIPLTEIFEFSREGAHSTGQVTWTEDEEPRVIGDLYTVCSRLWIDLPEGTRSGPERCVDFGPFE